MTEEIKNLKDEELTLDEALSRLDEFSIEQRMYILKLDIERKNKEKLLKNDYEKLIEKHKEATWEARHPRLASIKKRFGGNQFKF